MIAILGAVALDVVARATLSASRHEKLQFEELPADGLLSLDLSQGAGVEVYIDKTPYLPREPVSVATWMEQITRDLWLGFRALGKSPGFSAAAIALIAVGIGGNTAIYSMIHGVLTRPAPGVRGERLVSFGVTVNGQPEEPAVSYAEYLNYGFNSTTVHPVAAAGFGFFTLALRDGSYELRGLKVSENYFDTLGVGMARGLHSRRTRCMEGPAWRR